MREFFDIKGKLNIIKNFEQFNQVITLTDAVSFCEQLGLEFSRGKIEVLMAQKDFVAVGNKLIEPLKKGGAEVSPLLIEDNSALHTSIKIKSDEEIAACVVIGDSDLLNFARYYASLNKVPCYAIPFTPHLEDLLKSYVLLKTQNLPAKIEVDCFKKICVDEKLITLSQNESFAQAYISVINKLTALIDYRINSYLSGQNVDNNLFEIVKNSINTVALLPKYENYKSAIIYSELVLCAVNSTSTMLEGTGEQVVNTALKLFAPNMADSERGFLTFEKLSKIYHFYFSNDFSDLLVVADYHEDIKALEEYTKREKSYFSKKLKIPSENRRILINLLLEKTRCDFKAETTTILSVLKQVKKIYENLSHKSKKGSKPSYKQVKNAITLSTYLTDKTSVLTLCRDAGILKCAN